MDKDSFQKHIIKIIKQNRQSQGPVEHLPKDQATQLDSNVYAHIDNIYSESTDKQAATYINDAKAMTYKQHSIKSQLSDWFTGMRIQAIAIAFAAIAVVAVGSTTYHLAGKQTIDPFFDIPESVVAAELGKYIDVPATQPRAFASSSLSDRRSAFFAGVTQADLDIIRDADNSTAQQLAIQYHEITKKELAIDASEAMKFMHSSVEQYANNDETTGWFNQGYAVEILQLAALRSITDMDTSILQDALNFYQGLATQSVLQDTDIENQYIQNHQQLLNSNSNLLFTPDQVQQIITATQNMKLLIQ